MKLIKSIVRPNKVDEVKDALAKLNIAGMTASRAIFAAPRIPHRTFFMTHRLSGLAIIAVCSADTMGTNATGCCAILTPLRLARCASQTASP